MPAEKYRRPGIIQRKLGEKQPKRIASALPDGGSFQMTASGKAHQRVKRRPDRPEQPGRRLDARPGSDPHTSHSPRRCSKASPPAGRRPRSRESRSHALPQIPRSSRSTVAINPPLIAPSRNSTLPSGPVIGLGSTPRTLPALRSDPVGRFIANSLMNGRIANHPALPDFLAPSLELRLDQRDQPARPASPGRARRRAPWPGR